MVNRRGIQKCYRHTNRLRTVPFSKQCNAMIMSFAAVGVPSSQLCLALSLELSSSFTIRRFRRPVYNQSIRKCSKKVV